MNAQECRNRFGAARIVRLATVGSNGPHLVPVVFATDGIRIYSAVDHKRKRTAHLRRLANINRNPNVSLLADHYEEDWSRLWWVRVDGTARIIAAEKEMAPGLDLLVERYPQYATQRPAGPVIEIEPTKWSGWSSS